VVTRTDHVATALLTDEVALPIVMSRPPSGRVQLHRLEALHQFRCCRCKKAKRSLLVALVDGDAARPICNGCYRALSAQQAVDDVIDTLDAGGSPPRLVPPMAPKKKAAEKAPRAEKPKGASKTKTKQQKQKKQTKAQKRAQRQAEQREKHQLELLRQAEELFRFFRRARIDARSRHGEVIVNGKQVVPLSSLWGLRRRAYEDLRDQIAAVACSREFVEAMKRNAAGLGDHLRAYYDRQAHGFELRAGDEPIALIRAGRARIYGGASVDGNFLIDGAHWRRLEIKLAEHEKESAAVAKPPPAPELKQPVPTSRPEPAKRRVWIDDVPDGVSAELADEVLEASRKIREERRLAFDRPVTLECELGSLILSPIGGTPEYLRVPFTLMRHRQRIGGDIVLSLSHDPLPVHIDEDAALPVEDVWAAALLGLAAATCFELPAPHARGHPIITSRPSNQRGGRGGQNGGYRRMLSSSKSDIWPAHLRPIGSWARYSGAFVSGHRRRLHEGWSASADAIENARRVGIVLGIGETWVKPHARGLPEKLEIRFKWQPSEALLAAAEVRRERPW
jgi:hypothetical protein